MACFSIGYHHPDEHFQILEFSRWKLNPSRPEPLPWEFYYQMRAAIQPAMVVLIHKTFALVGCRDPFLITFFLRILSAGLTFLARWTMYHRLFLLLSSKKDAGKDRLFIDRHDHVVFFSFSVSIRISNCRIFPVVPG